MGQPGTLYTIEPDLESLGDLAGLTADGHSMDPVQVLRTVKAMGGQLGRILLVGCEPGDLGDETGLMGLTQAVRDAVERNCNGG